ncbi:carboxypeptidase-like regulatory domain-containing protein, partial [Nostoc sp. CCCryo 231-06]|nr:carboxypeptidase-like regulatory domain-containing protein [Nostoc sp. CCCryo 231-06]
MTKCVQLTFFLLLCAFLSHAQQNAVRGKVITAEERTVLPGVTVSVKGNQQIGTVTGAQGEYQINVPAGATTLVFSSIGFQTQEVTIGSQTTIDVSLATDTKQLTEVVVTAVGITREKKALGYSVSTINSSKIAQISEPDPLRSLSGKVAGVN